MTGRLTARAREIVEAARELLEQDGPEGLTMRRVAEQLGIRAPSLYKHVPDKASLEVAIIATGLEDLATTLEAAVEGAAAPLAALTVAYRDFALSRPHLYRLMTDRPLPREQLPAGLEGRAAAPLLRAAGNPTRARAIWAFAHGMVLLEVAQRFPPGADLGPAWQEGITAFQADISLSSRKHSTA